jgi:hypothetical protein
MSWHLVDCWPRLENIIVLAVLWHKSQLLVVVVFEKIGSDGCNLGETCLPVELDEVVAIQHLILIGIISIKNVSGTLVHPIASFMSRCRDKSTDLINSHILERHIFVLNAVGVEHLIENENSSFINICSIIIQQRHFTGCILTL